MQTTRLAPSPTQGQSTPSIDEEQRARVLQSYAFDSIDDDEELANIVSFAAKLCNAPTCLVSLVEVERQRFLARTGIEARETPRSVSFCQHAMLTAGGLQVCDASTDHRFADNALVTGDPHIRFYFGQPLIADDGTPLGALCVIDGEARPEGLDELQREGMAVLGQAVMRRLNARRQSLVARQELEQSDAQLRALADSMPAIAFSADANGKFDYFNRRWNEFCGFEDWESQAGPDQVHPDDRKAVERGWAEAIRNGTPYQSENRLRRADGEWRWMLVRAVPVRDAAGNVMRWFGTMTDVHDVRQESDTRDLLARELSHRIKNIFAVVAGLVSLNIRRKPEMKEFGDDIIATIRALGRAHDFVRPVDGGSGNNLQGLLAELFAPYGTGDRARVHVSGDELMIQPQAASPLALVFHELATNAAKYGALSNESGHVELAIKDAGEMLEMTWTERGGPPVDDSVDKTKGFGSRLIEMSLTGQLGGNWERRFEDDGLIVELTVSKKRIAV